MKLNNVWLYVLGLLAMSCSKDGNSTDSTNNNGGNTPPTEEKVVVAAYLPDYGLNRYDPNSLALLDRLYYFSIEPTVDGQYQMKVADSINVDNLKKKLSSTQELYMVIGGWVKSQNIPAMAADPAKRASYITELVGFCKRNGVQGVDLDWEDNPGAVNQSQYTTLVREMYTALHAAGLHFSVALGEQKAAWAPGIKDYVDDINIMNYGKLDGAGQQSTMLQMKNALSDYYGRGVPKKKLHVGVPFYGKRTAAPVALEYYNIVASSPPAAAVNTYDSYSFNGRNLMTDKTAFLRQNGYGGIFAWELSQDVPVSSEYSLLKTIHNRNK